MFMKKKGQAALEFLTTYGWAFMVILVMIGALAYFGVLNPKNLIPESCVFPSGMECTDYRLTTTTVEVEIANRLSGPIIDGAAVCVVKDEAGNTVSDGSNAQFASSPINSGSSSIITCDLDSGISAPVGEKAKYEVTFEYLTKTGGLVHQAKGSVTATVQ